MSSLGGSLWTACPCFPEGPRLSLSTLLFTVTTRSHRKSWSVDACCPRHLCCDTSFASVRLSYASSENCLRVYVFKMPSWGLERWLSTYEHSMNSSSRALNSVSSTQSGLLMATWSSRSRSSVCISVCSILTCVPHTQWDIQINKNKTDLSNSFMYSSRIVLLNAQDPGFD